MTPAELQRWRSFALLALLAMIVPLLGGGIAALVAGGELTAAGKARLFGAMAIPLGAAVLAGVRVDLATQVFELKGNARIARKDSPSGYWIAVAVSAIGGVLLLALGVYTLLTGRPIDGPG